MNLSHELHDLILTMDRQAEEMLGPLGLTYRRYVALVIVGQHPGLTGRHLAGGLGVTEAAASGLVRSLLDAALVRDVSPAGSGHRRQLALTDSGTELCRRATDTLGTRFDDAVRRLGLDPHQLARTINAIHRAIKD